MLYIVATPIGNLKDFSFRAVETLKSVDAIACEDTRHSLTLLKNYEIKKPLISYHKFNEKESAEKIIDLLKQGKNVAVISDAGTPVISDPGNVLINEAIKNGIQYTVIPGACAFINALVLSGFNAQRFCFIGFLPEKQGERTKLLEKYKNLDNTLIFYSAPHDVVKDITTLYETLGDRKACAVREITKMYESVEAFNLKDGLGKEPKGEYVLIVEGKQKEDYSALSIEEHLKKYLDSGMNEKEAIKLVAKERNVSKNEVYKLKFTK